MTSMTVDSIPSEEDLGRITFEKYNTLPKAGKPNKKQWTVLSSIIQYDNEKNTSRVVALGTGTKCLGSHQLCPQGLILNDSHAEIVARRSFLRYIYDQISEKDASSVFLYNSITRKYFFKKNFSFHFFSTHSPCGDASIPVLTKDHISMTTNYKRVKIDPFQQCEKTATEVFTGAKILSLTEKTDFLDQEEGAVRTKPGRGVATLSMSCSDKIARWNSLGIQGALLNSILEEPIYVKSYTFCSNIDLEAISRAFYKRWLHKPFFDKHKRFHINKPEIRKCSIELPCEFIASAAEKDPCPASIIWCDVKERPLEIAVSGKRQGTTKKNWNRPSSSLLISKVALLTNNVMMMCAQRQPNKLLNNNNEEEITDLKYKTYNELKSLCADYQSAWEILKSEHIAGGLWTKKPEYLKNFK